MLVSLYTDAPQHNLALMKISSWHKQNSDEVVFSGLQGDISYGSYLFKQSAMFPSTLKGGSRFPTVCLPEKFEQMKPDYSLYPNVDFSLGYTYRKCFRRCNFCVVPEMNHPNVNHHSIWEFHDSKFKKICLLNNNTFFDPKWKETFEEIWDADLTVRDENGYDLRLMDEEKANALRKTHFNGQIHYAWDCMEDEKKILEGLKIAPKGTVYVLIGFNTTIEDDLYRCQKIIDHKFDPYIMPYNKTKREKAFKRMFDTFMWRKYKTVNEAWLNYKRHV